MPTHCNGYHAHHTVRPWACYALHGCCYVLMARRDGVGNDTDDTEEMHSSGQAIHVNGSWAGSYTRAGPASRRGSPAGDWGSLRESPLQGNQTEEPFVCPGEC